LQSKDGLLALDIRTGKTIWTSGSIKEKITKIIHTGKYLCLAQSEKGWFSEKHTLSLVNTAKGSILWRYETDPILGNVVESKEAIIFSTKNRIIALELKKGTELYTVKLPWDDEFSSHAISLRDQAVMVMNEWNVGLWNSRDGKLIYHHHFEPLCPIMTTQERMLEQKALGRPVSGMTVNTFSYTSSLSAADYTAKFNQSMANYRRTGDSLYLNEAQFNYGMTRHAIGQERLNASMQFSQSLANLTMSLGVSILQKRVSTAHALVYPAIDAVLNNYRAFDNAEYAVRLVGLQQGPQRFSAIDILQLSTGKSKHILLSPYQLPADLKTLGSSFFTATEVHGYLPVSIYIPHSFLTSVDFKRKRIYHYGPGLDTDQYVSFGKKGFIRGRLWALPLDLPNDQ
jgi:hypothetical protein